MSQFPGTSQSDITRIPRKGRRTRAVDFGDTGIPARPGTGIPAAVVGEDSALSQIAGSAGSLVKLGGQVGKQKQADKKQVQLTERMDRQEGIAAARGDAASHHEDFANNSMQYRVDENGAIVPIGNELASWAGAASVNIQDNESEAYREGYVNQVILQMGKAVLTHRNAEGQRNNEELLASTAQLIAAGTDQEEALVNLNEGWFGTLTESQIRE